VTQSFRVSNNRNTSYYIFAVQLVGKSSRLNAWSHLYEIVDRICFSFVRSFDFSFDLAMGSHCKTCSLPIFQLFSKHNKVSGC